MKEVVDRILEQVEADISEIDLYGYNIIETSLSMVHRLQTVLNENTDLCISNQRG